MTCGRTAVVFDARGLSRAVGTPHEIVAEVRRLAAADGFVVRAALSGTMAAAWLYAHASTERTVIDPGGEAAALAPLPLSLLKTLPGLWRERSVPVQLARATLGVSRSRGRNYRLAPGPPRRSSSTEDAGPDADEVLAILMRWGVSTLGEFGALPRAEIRTRLGAAGVRLHEAACGEDAQPLVPADEPATFEERLELEWPIDGLEPLSFVLARLFDSLAARLERADRGAIRLVTRLGLVTKATHERTLTLPAPMRDARVLRTLVTLDLESHPPPAGIDVVALQVDVAPGRIDQGSLLDRIGLVPEDLTTLLARLGALVGETRVGAPVVVDSHDARRLAIVPFRPASMPHGDRPRPADREPPVPIDVAYAVRRFRLPVTVRVAVERGSPVRIDMGPGGLAGGRVVSAAGPWRTSGAWWSLAGAAWDRDEWEVGVEAGPCYRLTRDRSSGRWEVEGVVD
jgi:protein ImuB